MSVKLPSAAQTMDRDERVRRFGIECIGPSGDGIFFKAGTWRPGGEYIQKLIIRNVSVSVKKLKYKLPSTRYFSMAYPEPIILSPGLAQEVDIVFRPVEYESYDDTIYIKMLDGIDGNGFHIPVRATIDNLSLKVPSGLDLGFCATHQTTSIVFKLENTGEIDAPYRWDVPAPFHLVPSQGVVAVGKSHEMTVSIIPQNASVFVAQAICYVGEGVHAIIPEPIITMKLSSIGKFAYINLSDPFISFDEVVSGTVPDKKEIALINNSVVPAEFALIRLDNDRDEVFGIEPKNGIIPPLSEIPITIEYKALAMGCYSRDRYAFRTPGNCNTILNLRGMSMPPRVMLYKDVPPSKENQEGVVNASMSALSLTGTLSNEEGAPLFSFNFRDVEIGKVATRIMYIRNDSKRAVPFCVVADENGAFQMSPKQGIIPPLTKQFAVILVFAPSKPMNYYRRFFVLVEDALPLFYDCLGTGFIRAKGEIKEQRPAPIRHAHVQAFRNRNGQGMGVLSPDELDSLYENPEAPSSFFAQIGRVGTKAMSVTEVARPVTRTGESVRTSVAPAHEFFISDTDSSAREITANKVQLNFGFAHIKNASQPQSIVLTNNTHGKVMVQWLVPIVQGMNKKENNDKSSREHQMITVDAAEKELLQLQAFTVTPAVGEIPPGSSMSFDICFRPKQSNRNFISELEAYVYFKNQRTFRLVNDYSLTPPWLLSVNAIGHTFASGQLLAKARCSGGSIYQNKLLFPCCFKDESTYQTFKISNTSNLPCLFSLHIGWGDESMNARSMSAFSVKPSVGEIAAESFVLVCVRFSPTEIKRYTDLLRLVINGDDGGRVILEGQGAVPFLIVPDLLQDSTPYPEQIIGLPHKATTAIPKGLIGELFMRPTSVGLTSQRTITLKNASRLPLRYRISLPSLANGVLTITPMSGTLKGNDDIALKVVFSPKHAETYNFAINVTVFPLGGRPKRVLDSNQPGPVDRPEMLQNFSLNIQAQGEIGAITFDPPHTDIAVRLVHTQEEKAIWLENVSDSELHYSLYYREEFEADGVEIKTGRVTELSDTMRIPQPPLSSTVAAGEFQHSLFCDKPEGRIGGRSRLRLVLTYKPCKSGLFDFSLLAKIRATTANDDEQAMVSNDEAIVMRMSSTMQNSKDEADLVENLALLPLTASIQARAAFPKLLFEDIRTESDLQISDIDYLWNRFSFARLNYDLSVPLTAREIALNNSSSPDLSQLVVYPCEFAPSVLHSPTQTVDIVLRNHGYLETAFRMSLPNEKQLELENWCDEDEPSEALNRLICIIEELRLFTIEPKVGRLGPGESMVVRISYKHSSLKYNGIHNLPVLIRISQGKQFYLNIRGRTLAGQVSTNYSRRTAGVKITDAGGRLLTSAQGSVMSPATAGNYTENNTRRSPSGSLVRTAATGSNSNSNKEAPLPNNGLPDILLVLGSAIVPENIVQLAPVPIGLSYAVTTQVPFLNGTYHDCAPLQRIELINVSAYHVQYEVVIGDVQQQGMTSDEFVRSNNHNLDVLSIANPKGQIASGSSVYLEWYFYPVEAREYKIPFYVRYSIVPPNTSNMFPLLEEMDSFGGLGSPIGGSAIVFSNTISAGNSSRAGLGTGQTQSKRQTTGQSRAGGSKGNNNQSTRALALAEKQAADALAAAALAHTLIMTAEVRCVGYDPRLPKPKPHSAMYLGGLPPIRPVLQSSDKMVTCYEDSVDFGLLPQRAVAHRVILLTNRSATGIFDFSIDTTSCSLCTDQLISFSPVSGRIEPGGQAVVQVTLHALTQSTILLTEHVKIIVREVIKTTARNRGGTKAMLLNKLRARKTVNTPHESVVSRVTASRAIYVVTEPEIHFIDNGEMSAMNQAALRAEQRPTGKFPSTVTEKGEVIAPDIAKTLRQTLGAAQANVTFAEHNLTDETYSNYGMGNTGFAETLQLQSSSGPPSPTDRSVYSRNSRSAGAGMTTNQPEDLRSRQSASRGSMESGLSRRQSAGSIHSGVSGSSGTSGGNHQLFGATYILMVRIKGSVLSAQTIDRLFARSNAYQPLLLNQNGSKINPQDEDAKHRNTLGVINPNHEYLQWCREEAIDFVPPVGRKYYDDNVREELIRVRNKPKVNINQVFGRDAELRQVVGEVFDILAKSLLGQYEVRDSLQDVLHPADMVHACEPHQSHTLGLLSLRHRTPLSATFSQNDGRSRVAAVTGVYAQEVFEQVRQRSTHQQLILYLKQVGHSSKAGNSQEQELEELEEETAVVNTRIQPKLDDKALEDRALRDEDSYALPAHELKIELLNRLQLQQSTPFLRDWERTEADLVQSARTNPSTARDGNSSSVHGGVSLLTIKEWVYTLSNAGRRELSVALHRARDERLQRKMRQAKGFGSMSMSPTNNRQSSAWSEAGDNPPAILLNNTAIGDALMILDNDANSANSRDASTPASKQRQALLLNTVAAAPPERAVVQLIARPDFYATASETLNQLFLNIVRDLVDSESAFAEDIEAATNTEARA